MLKFTLNCRGLREEKFMILSGPKSLEGKTFWYSFSDGAGCSIEVSYATPQEVRAYRKARPGFAQYDWMVLSILRDGRICCADPTQTPFQRATTRYCGCEVCQDEKAKLLSSPTGRRFLVTQVVRALPDGRGCLSYLVRTLQDLGLTGSMSRADLVSSLSRWSGRDLVGTVWTTMSRLNPRETEKLLSLLEARKCRKRY